MSPEAIKAEQKRRQAEADAKAAAAKQRKDHILACVSVGICPDCGDVLESVVVWASDSRSLWECPNIECFKLWCWPYDWRSSTTYYYAGSEIPRAALEEKRRDKERRDKQDYWGPRLFIAFAVLVFATIAITVAASK